MAKASSTPEVADDYRFRLQRIFRESVLALSAGLTIGLLMGLISYHPDDPGWSTLGAGGDINNLLGVFGAWLADVLLSLFGWIGFTVPALVFMLGWMFYRHGFGLRPDPFGMGIRTMCLLLFLPSACGLAEMHMGGSDYMPQGRDGGILGLVVANGLIGIFNYVGTTWLLTLVVLVSLSIGLGFSWFVVMDGVGAASMKLWSSLQARIAAIRQRLKERRQEKPKKKPLFDHRVKEEKPKKRKKKADRKTAKATQLDLPIVDESIEGLPEYDENNPLPSVELLDEAQEHVDGYDEATLKQMSEEVEKRLKEFGVTVTVVQVQPGPVVTRFEIEPAPGVKVSQISNLAKDLARALSVISVRVVEVIPGKSVVGLEIPNEKREIVMLREIVESAAYTRSRSNLTLALGKDIGGHAVTADLEKMPHLLVAGTTGSGKSVAVNSMILSMLYKSSAAQARFIMIDPKMLELSVYEGIPHLLSPVVTDMKEAANALRWCVAEMERRYKLMAALGVRNLAGYNKKVTEAMRAGKPISDPLFKVEGDFEDEDLEIPTLEELPKIVIIIDELADMMMVVGKKVEELIARLAQKARAAGLHLIVATQRPSVDVITGLIKANIPTRMAFQVSSRVDSRTILDQMGAEALLGHGDMLFLPPGKGLPERVHGAFVDDHEVHKVVAWLKQAGEPDYIPEITEGGGDPLPGESGGSGSGGDDGEADPLYDEAVKVVTESRKASISYVQRRLRVGYNRAARLVEQMEESGVVGPLEGGGSRDVLAPPPPED